MKMLVINGSPRKNWNTAQLLEQIVAGGLSAGAEAELVHLGDLNFSGCISCFACKLIGGPSYGRCAVRDDLKPVLQKAHEADVLVLGTPIYFGTETGLMRNFLERLWFQYYLYSNIKKPLSPKKKAAALVYTMNVEREAMREFGMAVTPDRGKEIMEDLFAPCEVILSCDTLQFDDYTKYDTDMWDAAAKKKRHAEIFPQELQAARELGARLVK